MVPGRPGSIDDSALPSGTRGSKESGQAATMPSLDFRGAATGGLSGGFTCGVVASAPLTGGSGVRAYPEAMLDERRPG